MNEHLVGEIPPGAGWPDRSRLHRAFTSIGRKLLAWGPVTLFLAVFFFYPLLRILGLGWIPATLPVLAIGSLPLVGQILSFTFEEALLSTLLTFVLGLPAALLFQRFEFRGKAFLRVLTAVPFMLPTVVVASGFDAWLGPRGWVNLGLMKLFNLPVPPVTFVGTLAAILCAHVFYNTTIVIRVVGNGLSQLDARLEQAARTLGADGRRSFLHVTLPLLRPSLLAAALLVFIFDFTSFGVILLLGGPYFSTLEVEIYQQAVQLFNLPLAAWLAFIQLLCTLVFSILYTRIAGKGQARTAPRPAPARRAHGRKDRLLVTGMILLLLTFYLLPLVSLPFRSLVRLEADQGQRGAVHYGLTLAYYAQLFVNPTGSLFYVPPAAALGYSLGYAALTVLLSLGIGFPAASALAHPGSLEKLLDPLLLLPLGASAVTLGLGFIVSFGPLLASPWMVPLVHTLIALPFVIRTLQPAMASIPEPLHQAAGALGASPLQTWFMVDWPIIRRATLSAAVFAFTVSLGEFGATMLVVRPDYPTLPVAIYRFLSQPGGLNYGQAMAMATILMVVCGVGILAIEKLRLPGMGEF